MTLESEKVAVVGAGRMRRLLLQHLQSKGCCSLTLINRTKKRAEDLSAAFPDIKIDCQLIDELDNCLSISTLVFTSTAANEPIIDAEKLTKIDRKPLLRLIDIGVPRNISSDAKSISGIESHDVDDFKK